MNALSVLTSLGILSPAEANWNEYLLGASEWEQIWGPKCGEVLGQGPSQAAHPGDLPGLDQRQ